MIHLGKLQRGSRVQKCFVDPENHRAAASCKFPLNYVRILVSLISDLIQVDFAAAALRKGAGW